MQGMRVASVKPAASQLLSMLSEPAFAPARNPAKSAACPVPLWLRASGPASLRTCNLMALTPYDPKLSRIGRTWLNVATAEIVVCLPFIQLANLCCTAPRDKYDNSKPRWGSTEADESLVVRVSTNANVTRLP